MEKISTSRLVLRNFSVDDAEGLLGYLSNPRVNCFLSGKITTEKRLNQKPKRKVKMIRISLFPSKITIM